jgi:hypothetical protein
MRRLLLSVIALLALCGAASAQGVGAPNPILCNQATQSSANTATQLATAIPGRNIVICGWDINANVAAGAFTLAYGTGTTCATSPVTIVSYTALPAGVFVDHGTYAFFSVPNVAGVQQNLCVTLATTAAWIVYWGQF